MKTAKQFWYDQFGEYPQNDQEKLAVAMMAQYAEYVKRELTENSSIEDKSKENERT